MKRRLFLRNALTTTAGAFVVPTIIRSYVIGKNPPSDKINIGQIGCGRKAIESDLPEVLNYDIARVIAVCDVDSNRMADGKKLIENYYAKRIGSTNFIDVKIYKDYREMLLNPDIDAVIMCTPDHWHAQPAIEAALARKDIYLQKPATLTVAEGRLLSNIVTRQGVILQVGAQCRS